MGKSSDNSCCADWEERTIAANTSNRRKGPHRDRSRFYIFTVTALAVFLAGLLIRPPAPVGFEWETSIRHTVTGNAAAAAQLLATDPAEEFSQLCNQGTDQEPTVPCQLHIAFSSDSGDPAARTILVRHRHSDKEQGRACLTRAVDGFLTAHNRSDGEAELALKRDEAASILRFWESRVTTIERELADYVHFATRRQHSDVPVESKPSASSVPIMTATQVTNPRWESLSRQYHDADVRLRGLQERFTDAHPHVIEAQRVVAALERVLHATPQFVSASHAAPPNTASVTVADPQASDDHPTEADSATHPSDVTKSPTYLALNESLHEATERRRLAAETLREIPAKGSALIESSIVEQPVRLTQVLRSPIDRSFLLSQLVPALLLGLAMTIPKARVPESPTLFSSADVEASLDLPVYGTLSTTGEPVPPQPVVSPFVQSTRRIVTACELAIVVSLLAIVLCAVISPGFVSEAVQDPLGAIGSVLHRLGVYR